MQETWIQCLDQENPLEKEVADSPLKYSCLGNPTDRGAWWAAVHGITKSRTRLSDFTFTLSVLWDWNEN